MNSRRTWKHHHRIGTTTGYSATYGRNRSNIPSELLRSKSYSSGLTNGGFLIFVIVDNHKIFYRTGGGESTKVEVIDDFKKQKVQFQGNSESPRNHDTYNMLPQLNETQ